METMSRSPENPNVGVLVGGGPAPGINGVISALTLEARNRGHAVLGIYDGFQWLMAGDTGHVRELDHEQVSRVHFQGGSILNTSRANPTKRNEDLRQVVASLDALRIGYLATIGGDDTMFAASRVAAQAGGRIRVCHVPKTIDNDLPLPGEIPTFGFETARQLGSSIVQNLMEDSRSTGRWYFVVVMGRSAGHLALGIGKSTGATLTVIPEEFTGPIHLETVCDILEGAILKRKALWNRADGVAIIAEGLLERLPPEELNGIEAVRIAHDDYGHLRLAEVDLAYILKTLIERRFAARRTPITVVHKNIGYELRSAPPIAFDCEYVRALGYGAVEFLLNPTGPAARLTGALVCLIGGQLEYLDFASLLDPATGKSRIRAVDIDKPSYKIAREYMIRLEREDFEKPERLSLLARAAASGGNPCTPEQFRERFGYLTTLRGGA
ncbi:MAG TPA: diphosphate--fructose-6-phosphate 1-phosphotransferase [candidate division Zixibacteria bacterium]|nr:diphosphate--fructose-6-phosphate 1-phosphotransferase [candidate division Zixibacteria bacterium]